VCTSIKSPYAIEDTRCDGTSWNSCHANINNCEHYSYLASSLEVFEIISPVLARLSTPVPDLGVCYDDS
jgi:hypothetical protein